MNFEQMQLQRAFGCFQTGQLNEAARLFREILQTNKKNYFALHFLGLIEFSHGDQAEGLKLLKESLKITPMNIQFVENYVSALFKAERFSDALEMSEYGLRHANGNRDLLYIKAVSTFKLEKYEESLKCYDVLLAEQADNFHWLSERAAVLSELGFRERANRDFTRALELNPQNAEGFYNYGNFLDEDNLLPQALASYEQAIRLKPDYFAAHYNHGRTLAKLDRLRDALTSYERALLLNPHHADTHYNKGVIFIQMGRADQAVISFNAAYAIDKDLPYLRGFRIYAKSRCHDWAEFDADLADLKAAVEAGKVAAMPFAFLSVTDSSEDYLRLARAFSNEGKTRYRDVALAPTKRDQSRIRVGYISADFRDHPIAQAMSSILERHDRAQFEIIGVAIGPTDKSDVAQRMMAGCDRFHDLYGHGPQDIGQFLKDLDLDLLLVTAVHTEYSNVGLFVERYAPVQVNFLSAWSSGCDFFDYMVADPRCVLDDDKSAYSEKIVSVRGFLSDQSQVISANKPSRQDCGLPAEAFVYCCFNDHYKINPQVFDSWMNILRKADGSVLWLKDNAYGRDRLRAEAVKRGIDPERLIFAPRTASISDHLARLDLADLTLDTLPYGGHTTMRDSLFAGVPVLTQYGNTFVGRIGASLLDDVGLNELITHSAEEYEALAVELARSPAKLAQIRAMLRDRLARGGLFDTDAYMADLEAAFRAMVSRYRAGERTDHITEEGVVAFRQS